MHASAGPEGARSASVKGYLGLALITLLAFVLRYIGAGSRDYWHDEVQRLLTAEYLRDVIFKGDLVSNHPPLFPVLTYVWRSFGLDANEWTMRLLPVVLGVLGVIAIYFLGRMLFGQRTGLLAAFLLAISPFHIYHSQELKAYILLPLVGTIAIIFLYRGIQSNRTTDWVLYGLFAGLSCYAELFAGPLLIGVNLWAVTQLWGKRDRVRPWLLANVGGALLFLPQLPIMLQKANNILIQSKAWWIAEPTPSSVAFYLKTISFGYPAEKPEYFAALLLFGMITVVGAFLCWKQNWRGALLLFCWFVIPVALVYAISISPYSESIFLLRALLPYALPVYVIAAVGVAQFQPRAASISALAAHVLLMAVSLYYTYNYIHSPYEWPHRPGVHPPSDHSGLANYVEEHRKEGDILLHASESTWLPYFWYGSRTEPGYHVTPDADFINFLAASTPRNTRREEFNPYFIDFLQPRIEGKERLWFIFADWERSHLKGSADHPSKTGTAWRWLDSHALEIDHLFFQGMDLILYDNTRPADNDYVRRDNDNGFGATLYPRTDGAPYRKTLPYVGLDYTPPDNREGKLRLAFQGGGENEPRVRNTTEFVSFHLENRSGEAVDVFVDAVRSTVLTQPAQFWKGDIHQDVWHVYPMSNPGRQPDFYEQHVATALVNDHGDFELHGDVQLPAGRYRVRVLLLAHPGNMPPRVVMGIDGRTFPLRLPLHGQRLSGWHWVSVGEITRAQDGAANVTLTASLEPNHGFGRLDIAFIAFEEVANREEVSDVGGLIPIHPGKVTLSPGASRGWEMELDPDERLDVWAYEEGPDGRAYHIYLEPAAKPAG